MSRPTFKEDDEQLVIYMTGAGMLRIFYSSFLILQGSNVIKLQVFPNLCGKCCLKQIT